MFHTRGNCETAVALIIKQGELNMSTTLIVCITCFAIITVGMVLRVLVSQHIIAPLTWFNVRTRTIVFYNILIGLVGLIQALAAAAFWFLLACLIWKYMHSHVC